MTRGMLSATLVLAFALTGVRLGEAAPQRQARGRSTVTGRAVPRPGVPVVRPPAGGGRYYRPYYGRGYYPYYPYYRTYPYYYSPGFTFGVSFGYPYVWAGYGYGYPYAYGYPYGYGSYPYPAYGYPPAAYAGAPYGGVRLADAPSEAQVFVDGYYVGIVDNFDNAFQQINLTPGAHRIEIRAAGEPAVAFDVNVEPGRTITYHATR